MTNKKVNIVYALHWKVWADPERYVHVDYRKPKIRKIFYEYEDACKYIENDKFWRCPDIKWKESELKLQKLTEEAFEKLEDRFDIDSGFELYIERYDIEYKILIQVSQRLVFFTAPIIGRKVLSIH